MAGMVTKNSMTKRRWNRIRGKMIEQQPSWTRHLREIPYGSPEVRKAIESRAVDIHTTAEP